MDQQKRKTQTNNDDNEEKGGNSSYDLPDWLEEFTLPVLPMNYIQGLEQKWYRVSIAFLLTSQRTEIAMSA